VIEPSPIHATARRRAGATLTALAVAIDREGRTDAAAADALVAPCPRLPAGAPGGPA
jgi:hypothetical protein